MNLLVTALTSNCRRKEALNNLLFVGLSRIERRLLQFV